MIWHSENRDRVLEALDVGQECGLTSERAAERLQSFGPNKLREKKSRTFLGRFLDQMKERSAVESDVTVTCSDKVLTISTCTPGGTGRFLVMGKLVKVDNEI